MLYSKKYDPDQLRGDQENQPWEVVDLVRSMVLPTTKLLDVGCGPASKLVKLAPYVFHAVGLEPSPAMREQAAQTLAQAGCDNVEIVDGIAELLPCDNETVDVVTVMLAPHSTSEVFRVLKPGGIAVVEKVGDRDKENLKRPFGKDVKGWRGQFLNYEAGARAVQLQQEFEALFSKVIMRNELWNTYYTEETLRLLLEATPMVRGYHPKFDEATVRSVSRRWKTERGIQTQQNRILIVAHK